MVQKETQEYWSLLNVTITAILSLFKLGELLKQRTAS